MVIVAVANTVTSHCPTQYIKIVLSNNKLYARTQNTTNYFPLKHNWLIDDYINLDI